MYAGLIAVLTKVKLTKYLGKIKWFNEVKDTHLVVLIKKKYNQ